MSFIEAIDLFGYFEADKKRLEEAKIISAQRLAREADAATRLAREQDAEKRRIYEERLVKQREQEKFAREELEKIEREAVASRNRKHGAAANADIGCPVCERVIRAVKREVTEERTHIPTEEILSYDSAAQISRVEIRRSAKNDEKASYKTQFEKYCNLPHLPVEEQKFCYDTDSIRQDLYKMLDFGADVSRICKKVLKANPDFCRVSPTVKLILNEAPKSMMVNIHENIRGVIYQ